MREEALSPAPLRPARRRRHRAPAGLIVVLALAGDPTRAANEPQSLEPPAPREATPPAESSPQAGLSAASFEVLRRDCRTAAGRREVTLFLNGTVRLREGPSGHEVLELGELGPAAREGFLRRLEAEDLSEVDAAGDPGVEGGSVERCVLVVEVPGSGRRELHYGRFESLPLALAHVVGIADELAEVPYERRQRLPAGYRPRMGDVLRRNDGELYEVIGRTVDGKGVELQGVDQPLTLFLPELDLGREFDAVVRRR